jgi:hypothetical protein
VSLKERSKGMNKEKETKLKRETNERRLKKKRNEERYKEGNIKGADIVRMQ